MKVTDSQFMYIFLILPALFGITLISEGLSKIVHNQWTGLINISLGLIFMAFVFISYFVFTTYFSQRV